MCWDVEICEDFDGESITLELEGSYNIDNVNDKRVRTRIGDGLAHEGLP